MALMASISGLRGIVGEDINPLSILNFTEAFINSIKLNNKRICVGRDNRKSGLFIKNEIISTLNGLGIDAVDIGISPTPTTLHATRNLGCDGGIVITASHNPSMWNALKFCSSEGLFLNESIIKNILNISKTILRKINWASYNSLGNNISNKDYYKKYIDNILQHFNVDAIRKRNLIVAFDPVGGAASEGDRYFFEKLGCKAIAINSEITGDFPRNPEPTPKNLIDLANTVKENRADIGFAQDPDADRLSIVSNTGRAISEEYTLILAGEGFLRKHKTDVACNLSTSMLIDDLAKKYSVQVFRTKIGEFFVTEKMLKNGIEYGGEGNGGVIIPSVNPCRDSFVGMAQILELISETGGTVEDIISDYPDYIIIKDKVDLKNIVEEKERFYDILAQRIKDEFQNIELDTTDGVKVIDEKKWLHIRLSNTEPQIRLVSESLNKKTSLSLIEIGKKIIRDIIHY